MNKTELIAEIEKQCGADLPNHAAAVRVVDHVFQTIINETASGNPVVLSGFGKFTITERKARKGHNPKTGESMDISATNTPHFKAGAEFKAAVNK